jgi:hypothetical protein
MTLQTKTVVAETFVHLRQCLAEIEIEINARALRVSSLPPPQPGKMTPLHSDHVGGMEGQGRGAEVRAAWGQLLIQQPKVLVEPRPGALQVADARLDGSRFGLRGIDSRTDSVSEGDRQPA